MTEAIVDVVSAEELGKVACDIFGDPIELDGRNLSTIFPWDRLSHSPCEKCGALNSDECCGCPECDT